MSDPISRPLEPSEISRLAGGDAYRFEMLLSQKNMEHTLTEMREDLKDHTIWRIEHDKKDALEFQSVREEVRQIRWLATGAQSGVNDYEESKQQFNGMRKLLIGIVAVIAAIGGGIIGLFEILKLIGNKS